MGEILHECKVVRVLVTAHAYGSPLPADLSLRRAAIPSDELGAAKAAMESVRSYSFIEDHGSRGLMLDNGEFDSLAQWLYRRCDWKRFELELRLKHFEGWDELDW